LVDVIICLHVMYAEFLVCMTPLVTYVTARSSDSQEHLCIGLFHS